MAPGRCSAGTKSLLFYSRDKDAVLVSSQVKNEVICISRPLPKPCQPGGLCQRTVRDLCRSMKVHFLKDLETTAAHPTWPWIFLSGFGQMAMASSDMGLLLLKGVNGWWGNRQDCAGFPDSPNRASCSFPAGHPALYLHICPAPHYILVVSMSLSPAGLGASQWQGMYLSSCRVCFQGIVYSQLHIFPPQVPAGLSLHSPL